jgi:hypothetical protein
MRTMRTLVLAALLASASCFSLAPGAARTMILSSGILSSGSASVQLRTGISGALRRHAQTLAALRMVDAQRMLGTWSLQQELEEKEPKTFFLTLIDGGTVEMPPDESVGKRDDRVRQAPASPRILVPGARF